MITNQQLLKQNDLLINSITAQSIVLFVQQKLGKGEVDGEKFALLKMSTESLLYVIREFNGYESTIEGSDKKIEIERASHQELYYLDYNINKLFTDYISTQPEKWQQEYAFNIDRVSKNLQANLKR